MLAPMEAYLTFSLVLYSCFSCVGDHIDHTKNLFFKSQSTNSPNWSLHISFSASWKNLLSYHDNPPFVINSIIHAFNAQLASMFT